MRARLNGFELKMQLFIEFIEKNWMLALVWGALVLALYVYESMKAGKSVGVQGLSDLVNREQAIILDIREASEFKQGHIINAWNIPQKDIENRMVELEKSKDKPVVVVCKLGQSASGVTKKLKAEGFSRVDKLAGGMTEWTSANLPLVKS
jgi:rhodanese-related sulfurtransferase